MDSIERANDWCARFNKGKIAEETKKRCKKCVYCYGVHDHYPTCDYNLVECRQRTWNEDGSCACYKKRQKKRTSIVA